MEQFSTLIITFNSRTEIIPLLTDIYKLTDEAQNSIIVIDNASQDGTAEVIASQFPGVHLTVNRQNLGFTRAVNQGFELCQTEYVFLLNPDMRIRDHNFFPRMLASLKSSPNIAAVGPMQFKGSGQKMRLNYNWSFWNPRSMWVYLIYALRKKIPYARPYRTTFLNAGCLLLRRTAFMEVGRLSEKYFMYGEEPDLFLKFKRYGYECRLHPGLWVIHHREKSLETLPKDQRIRRRMDSFVNIVDALAHGYFRLIKSEWKRFARDIRT